MTRVLVAVAVIALLVPATTSRADAPPRPRSAVAVTAAPGVDSFVQIYVFEIGAGVLHAGGFDVVPPNAASERLRATERDANECSRSDECVIELSTALRAPTLVLAHVTRDGARYALRATTIVVSDSGIERVESVEHTGNETDVAERTRAAVTALSTRPPPCVVRLEVAGGLAVSMTIDAAAPVTPPQMLFLRPGRRRLALSATGRAPWRGEVACESAHAYRISVR